MADPTLAWLLSLNCSTEFGRGIISWQQTDCTLEEAKQAFENVVRSSAPGVVADPDSLTVEQIEV